MKGLCVFLSMLMLLGLAGCTDVEKTNKNIVAHAMKDKTQRVIVSPNPTPSRGDLFLTNSMHAESIAPIHTTKIA